MKKILPLFWVLTSLFSCGEKDVFVKENIIPSPKEFVLNNDKLREINEVVVLETSDNLSYPQNKDEYYIKIKKGNVVIEGNEV